MVLRLGSFVLQEWTGEFWVKTTLRDLGLIYQLGHGGGRCVYPDAFIRNLTVMHSNGIHQLQYCYCSCDWSDHADKPIQFLRNRWYPATPTNPSSCATFNVLEEFRLLNVGGNVNGSKFVRALEELTDASQQTWVLMCRQLLGSGILY